MCKLLELHLELAIHASDIFFNELDSKEKDLNLLSKLMETEIHSARINQLVRTMHSFRTSREEEININTWFRLESLLTSHLWDIGVLVQDNHDITPLSEEEINNFDPEHDLSFTEV